MTFKQILTSIFLMLYTFSFNYQILNAQSAKLISITNNTEYKILFEESVEVPPQKTLSSAPLPAEIPKELPGIAIEGTGKRIEPFFSGQVIDLYPLLGKGWGWLYEEYQRAQVTATFQSKAEADIRIAFNDKFSTDPMYTVVIGGEGNTRSYILKKGSEKAYVTREENPDAMVSIIKGQEAGAFIPFWICYDRGLILVGKGWPGDNIFLSWKDPDPNSYINKIGLGSNDKQVQFTNVLLLPPVITFPPKEFYESITPVKEEKQQIQKIQVDDTFLQYGTVVQIKNLQDGQGLKVFSPSPKVIVKGNSDWWIIKGPNGTPDSYKFGEKIRNGSVVRLENFDLRKNLNFNGTDIEVVGESGVGNVGDNWIVQIKGAKKADFWNKTNSFNLVNQKTKDVLTFTGKNFVTAVKQSDQNVLWQISNNQAPITNKELPVGSIVTFKTPDNKYLNVKTSDAILKEPLRFGDLILLKNTKEFLEKGRSTRIDNYLFADGANRVIAAREKQRWKIINSSNPDAVREIRFGDIVSLQSAFGKYLGKMDKGKKNKNRLVPFFEKIGSNVSFVVVDPINPLNRGIVNKGSNIAFESVDKSYISNFSGFNVALKPYMGDDESWKIVEDSQIKKDVSSRVFVSNGNVTNKNFATQFRVIRTGGAIGFESLFNNENLAVSKDFGWNLSTQDSSNFYNRENKTQKFVLRKLGDNYYLLSLSTLGVVNHGGETGISDKTYGYRQDSIFNLEIISKPKIEILEAKYGNTENVFDVTDIVQSKVVGSTLLIPVGQDAKVSLFGDPVRGKEKVLSITYREQGNPKALKVNVTDFQPLLLGLSEKFNKTGIIDLYSGLNGAYFWLPYDFRVAGRGAISFEANAIDDIYIAFSAGKESVWGTDKQLYEIVIGDKDNSRVTLRKRSKASQLAFSSTPELIPQDGKFHKYWISINNGIILVGRGELGREVLLACKDLDPLLDINSIGISNDRNPVVCKNFNFAPPVDIGGAPGFFEEYQSKYQTFLEKVRKLIFLTPFKYSIYHKDSKQIVLKDEVGKQVPIGETSQKGLKDYPFSISIDAAGDPIPVLEWMPEETGLRKGLKFGGAMLSSISGVAGAIPDPRAQIAGAAGQALGQVAGLVSDALGGGVAGVRVEQYTRRAPSAYSDPEIMANNQRIQALMANIKQASPKDPGQFKYMIDSYRELILLIISVDNVDAVLKDRIFKDLRDLIKYHVIQSPDTYNSLINLLLKAHNNRFLFTEGDETKRKYIFAGANEVAKTLFRTTNEVEIEELLGEYLWLEQELPEPGNGSIVFEVDGEKDVFVAFSSEVGKIRETKKSIQMYELIIGTKNNTASVFRLENKGYSIPGASVSATKNSNAVLELGKYRKYWFSIKTLTKNGRSSATLFFGHDAMIPKNILLQWTDTHPFKNIKYVGIGSWEALLRVKNIKIGPPFGEIKEEGMYPIWEGARVGAPSYEEWVKHWNEVKQQKSAPQISSAVTLPVVQQPAAQEESVKQSQ